jgi:hypothetical protein
MIQVNGTGTVSSLAADGNVVLLLSADVEPTGGGTPRWWDGVSGTAPPTSTTPTGVHTRAWDATGGGDVNISLASSTLTVGVGVRFRRTSVAASDLIVRITDGSSGEHLEIDFVTGGNFRVNRNVTTQLAISTGGHIVANTWYYVEMTAVIADSPNGSFTCNLYDDSGNLLESISASGIDTRDGAGSGQQSIWGTTGYWEDAYLDATGEVYGPCQVEVVAPNGAGDLSQLTTSGTHTSDPNWMQVDEIPPAGPGVDSVISTGADQYDCYAFPNRTVTGTPITSGVSAACISSAGSVNFNFICRISGVTYEHPTTYTMTTTAKFFGGYWRNNPATGAPWTDAGINSAQFGIHMHATNGAARALYRATLVQL